MLSLLLSMFLGVGRYFKLFLKRSGAFMVGRGVSAVKTRGGKEAVRMCIKVVRVKS